MKEKKPKTQSAKKRRASADHGQVFFQWTFPERQLHERRRGWYIIAAVLAVLLIAYGIWTQDYLFIVIILLVALIYGLDHLRAPLMVLFQINEDGIIVGQRFFPYKELKNFWIAYDPPEVKWLYFVHKKKLFPEIAIPLADFNPLAIRKVLLNYLTEDLEKEEELPGDTMSRLLKL